MSMPSAGPTDAGPNGCAPAIGRSCSPRIRRLRPDGSDMSLEQAMVLQYEVEQFLYREAALLDDRRFTDWLALIADDIHYWMPIRRTVTVENLRLEYAAADGMAYFDDDKRDLRMRVEKLQSNSAWSENPPSRTRHFVSNVRILEATDNEIALEAA